MTVICGPVFVICGLHPQRADLRENEIIVLTVTNLGFEGDQGVKPGWTESSFSRKGGVTQTWTQTP